MNFADWIAPASLARRLLNVRNRHMALVDLVLLPLAAFLAFSLRLDAVVIRPHLFSLLIYAITAPLIKIPVLYLMGIYARFWQYASVEEVVVLGWAAIIGAAAQGAILVGVAAPLQIVDPIPRSIPLIDVFTTLACVAGPRFILRLATQKAQQRAKDTQPHVSPQRVLIAGAGDAGALVLREIEANPQTGLVPVGFVDDDPGKQGLYIRRRRVLGSCQEIPSLVRRYHVDQVIISMPRASGQAIRRIVNLCDAVGVRARIIPGVYELLTDEAPLRHIRNVQIEDLLRREPVQTDVEQVAALLRGRRVLVTGAGGSIGSELCRQIVRCQPAALVLLGHGENSIFEIHNELSRSLSKREAAGSMKIELIPVIADVRFADRLQMIFERYRPEIVFHAAAHKHVPLMESNIEDAITNNVLGTRNLVEVSMARGVTHFVLISSDKAVNPTSIMGASKRVAEQIVQAAAQRSGQCFVAVRFGNVLGSRGSVVPFFQKQIAAGGPVTVTHPEVRRYFMTIPEAVQLVLQAATLGKGGEVFVLDMGEPVRIVDLARDLIRLSGLEPGRDIEMRFTGLRPGEKLFEELFLASETYAPTRHHKIFVYRNGLPAEGTAASEVRTTQDPLDIAGLDALIAAAHRGDRAQIRDLLRMMVPEYQAGA